MKSCSQLKIRKLHKEMTVAIDFNNRWYRGEVLMWTDDDAFVLFVDFGLRHHVKVKNLRRLEDNFISEPRMACKGSLHGVKPPKGEPLWDVKTTIEFIGKVEKQRFNATVRDFIDGYYKLDLMDDKTMLSSAMIKKGLAESTGEDGPILAILVSACLSHPHYYFLIILYVLGLI
jgi:Tudor domain